MRKECIRIAQHLKMLGFSPKASEGYARNIDRWISNNGLEYVIDRLKSLKDYHLTQLSGKKPSIPSGWRVSRKGNFHNRLVNYALNCLGNSGKDLYKKQGFVRVYQVFRFDKPTESQLLKFREAVMGNYMGTYPKSTFQRMAASGVETLRKRLSTVDRRFVDINCLRSYPVSDKKRSPILRQLHYEVTSKGRMYGKYIERRRASYQMVSSTRTDIRCKDVKYWLRDPRIKDLITRFPEQFNLSMTGNADVHWRTNTSLEVMGDIPLGIIGYINEQGGKLRTVANPHLFIQALGEPLKVKLERITKAIPSVGTFNQEVAQQYIADKLLKTKVAYCFDSSSFTDRLPYELQHHILNQLKYMGLVNEFDISVMDMVSSGTWQDQFIPDGIRWTVGQPLGFGPSFHLCTLTHVVILQHLGAKFGDYRIVGDDIVIFDPRVALLYKDTMRGLGIQLNLAKSLISRTHAEFCGKTMVDGTITPTIKVKEISYPEQLLDIVQYYGWSCMKFMNDTEKDWLKYQCFPIELGGLGKPPGVSDQDYWALFDKERLVATQLTRVVSESLLVNDSFSPESYRHIINFDKMTDSLRESVALSSDHPSGIGETISNPVVDHPSWQLQYATRWYAQKLIKRLDDCNVDHSNEEGSQGVLQEIEVLLDDESVSFDEFIAHQSLIPIGFSVIQKRSRYENETQSCERKDYFCEEAVKSWTIS